MQHAWRVRQSQVSHFGFDDQNLVRVRISDFLAEEEKGQRQAFRPVKQDCRMRGRKVCLDTVRGHLVLQRVWVEGAILPESGDDNAKGMVSERMEGMEERMHGIEVREKVEGSVTGREVVVLGGRRERVWRGGGREGCLPRYSYALVSI